MTSARVLLSACCLALAACADLGAVRDVSSRLTAASRSWDDVGGDIAGSCLREQSLNPLIVDCKINAKASEGLVAADRILTEYFSALNAAATESNFTVKPGLDALAASVASIPNINAAQVKAASGLVGLLVKLATERLREETLRELIASGAPAAKSLVDGLLGGVVVQALGERLTAERLQLSGFFAVPIQRQGDRLPAAAIAGNGPDLASLCTGSQASTFSAVGFLLTQEYCSRLAVVTKRQKALEDYKSSLAAASKALTELQSSSTRLKSAEVARKLYEIGRELDQSVAGVRKAFG